jgi:hypothetical protein
MNLSPNFTLEELTNSETAVRLNIDNTPTVEVIDNLKFLSGRLEDVRSILRCPMLISSGFRCNVLNDFLGSKRSSQHITGNAVDFIAPNFGNPRSVVEEIIKHTSKINYDQVILEFGRWIHLSFVKDNPRNSALIIDKNGARPFENFIY